MALKFPKPQVAAVATYHAAFVREAWVGRAGQQSLGRPRHRIAAGPANLPLHRDAALPGRAAVDPARAPAGWSVSRRGATSRSSWRAAWRRCIAPASSIATSSRTMSFSSARGSLKLIDLGVVRVPGLEDFPAEDIPGTLAYMAPEMFAGEPGNEQTDIYALGVTMFRAFTGEYPYGNLDAVSPPRRNRPTPLAELRPDLPAWLQAVLGRAIALDPAQRFRDVMEFAVEMEAGPARAPVGLRRPQTLYERAPVQFWQGVAAILALAVAFLVWRSALRIMKGELRCGSPVLSVALLVLAVARRAPPNAPSARLSDAADPHSGALCTGRHFGHCRADRRRQAHRCLRPAGHRREPAGRQRFHRGGGRREIGARRLHAGDGDRRRRRDQSGAVQGHAL